MSTTRSKRAVHEASGGNPLLVHELARAVVAEGLAPSAANVARLRDLGGQAVSRAVSLRLARVSPEARRLARAIAILGDGADLRHAAALAELNEAAVGRAAADLERVEVLRRDGACSFVYPLVRAAVYAELPTSRRGGTTAGQPACSPESGADPERVAAQVLLPAAPSGDAWAVSALQDAARSAVARGSPNGAVAYLRRALDEPPGDETADVLHELGSAEARMALPRRSSIWRRRARPLATSRPADASHSSWGARCSPSAGRRRRPPSSYRRRSTSSRGRPRSRTGVRARADRDSSKRSRAPLASQAIDSSAPPRLAPGTFPRVARSCSPTSRPR